MQAPALKKIAIAEITTDTQYLVREEINESVVDEYAAAMADGAEFPPIDVFRIGKGYFIANGWHRLYAMRKLEVRSAFVNVFAGTHDDCLAHALGANHTHGLRRSNADKRKSVLIAIEHWPMAPAAEIARICGVSATFVSDFRRELESNSRHSGNGDDFEMDKPHVMVHGDNGHQPSKPAALQIVRDRIGVIIPDRAFTYWDRDDEVYTILQMVKDLQTRLESIENSKDILWCEVNFNAAKAELEQLFCNLQTAVPYAVCSSCQGKIPDGCAMCTGRGVISKFRWDTAVPKEIKQMQEKLAESQHATKGLSADCE